VRFVLTDAHSLGKAERKINPHLYGCRTPKTPNVRVEDNYGPARSFGTRFALNSSMFAILCILGGLWLCGAALFVFALAIAAKKPTPTSNTETVVLKRAA
jgi:hypothetical protein